MQVLFAGNGNNLSAYSKHAHKYYEIILTVSGSAYASYDGETHLAERGHLALVPPNTVHFLENGDGYSDLYIATDAIDIAPQKTLVLSDDNGIIDPLMRTLYTVWVQKEAGYHKICDSLLGIIYEFIRKAHENKNRYDFVDKLKNTLALHLTDAAFSFSAEAAKLGISPDYLRHCFKADTGMTPLAYLTKLRIAQAKRYLKQNKAYSISEIAYLCGFTDPYYFSRCFKKQTGQSPKAYRSIAE